MAAPGITAGKNPGVTEMLALLETLKSAVEEFAAREEKLNHDFRSRASAEHNTFDSESRDLDARQAVLRENAQLALATELNRHETQYQRRKTAISRAQSAQVARSAGTIGPTISVRSLRSLSRMRNESSAAG